MPNPRPGRRGNAAPPPKIIDDFQLGEILGRGASGTVYRGLNVRTGDVVAIKVIPLHSIKKDDLNAIMMEISLLRKLRHPNIVKYIHSKTTKEYLFIILEYVEGGSLSQLCKKFGGSLPESLVRLYMRQVLDGLGYLHEQGVIHRDIKGANLLTTKDGRVKLADFGVAMNVAESSAVQDTNDPAGTPYWMAPEVIEMTGCSTASDVWSVGCTVIELVTGSPPYFDLQAMPALFRIVQDEHPPLPSDISKALRDFLLLCFQKDPNLRVSAAKLLRHPWIGPAQEQAAPDVVALQERHLARRSARLSIRDAEAVSAMLSGSAKPRRSSGSASANTAAGAALDTNEISITLAGAASADVPRPRPEAADEDVEVASDEDWDADEEEEQSPAQPAHNQAAKPQQPPSVMTDWRDLREKMLRKHTEPDTARIEESFEDDAALEDKIRRGSVLNIISPDDVAQNTDGVSVAMHTGKRRDLTAFQEDGTGDDDFADVDLGKHVSAEALVGRMRAKSSAADGLAAAHPSSFALGPSADADADSFASDESDPFADLEDGEFAADELLDDAEDSDAHLSDEIAALIPQLRAEGGKLAEGTMAKLQQLEAILRARPHLARQLRVHHGVVPLLEILDTGFAMAAETVFCLLNAVLAGAAQQNGAGAVVTAAETAKLRENLFLVGSLPAAMQYVSPKHSPQLRLAAGTFLRLVCFDDAEAFRTFVACRGLAALVDLLGASYIEEDERELVHIALEGIWRVFELDTTTPKNDFCRLLAQRGVLVALARATETMAADPRVERGQRVQEMIKRALNVLLLFACGDSVVKSLMSQQEVVSALVRVLDHLEMTERATVLKTIKFLSMDPYTHEPLQRAGVIGKMAPLFGVADGPAVKEVHNQILHALYNLCKVDRARQEQAAAAGIVPHLIRFVEINSFLKEFALPILFALPRAGPAARKALGAAGAAKFFVALVAQEARSTLALDALASWLEREPEPINAVLTPHETAARIVAALRAVNARAIEEAFAPVLRIAKRSPPVNRALARAGLVALIIERLSHRSASVRLGLLRLLFSVYEFTEHPKQLITMFGLVDLARNLLENDRSVLVQEMAAQMLDAFGVNRVV